MFQEFAFPADIFESCEPDLSHDSTKLAGSSRDTMGRRTVTGRENFPRDDEGCGVRAKVLEEVRKAVQEDECLASCVGRVELVVAKAHDDEKNCEHDETHELNWFTAPEIN